MSRHLKQFGLFLCVAVIVILSVICARLFHLIEIKYPRHLRSGDPEFNPDSLRLPPHQPPPPNYVLGDSPEHLFWFVQISDIHISMFHDPDRVNDLKEFCDVTIDAIKPEVVLASGDLADGKAVDHMGSNQYIQEWKTYRRIIEEKNVLNKTIWLDIRGNHDNFNVPGVMSHRSYFHQFSVQGKKHARSYMLTVQDHDGTERYSFIAVDACLEPGPRRPFNFIGNIDEEQYELLSSFERASHGSNGTIFFGHYPTSCIISPEPGMRELMRNSTAYLCGHLHTLGGMVPNMYTLQHSGLLELELGDWKDNRMFRVAAFDHGMFSFVDVSHGQWPIILCTSPKHALFTIPNKEPFGLVRHSSHIRLLVFSPEKILRVRIKVDDSDWMEATKVKGPLFVASWNVALYEKGIHNIQVYAEDITGRFREIAQRFSLDGTRLSFQLFPKLVLMTDAQHVFHGFFVTFVLMSVLPLVTIRIIHSLMKADVLAKPDFRPSLITNFLRRLWIVSTINKLCLPLILYPLYLTIGPWLIGEVIEGHIGASFAWGTVVHGKILPTAFTYFYGTIQLSLLHLPFLLILIHIADARYSELFGRGKFRSTVFITNVICGVDLLIQAAFGYYFWLAYGTVAFIFGFMRTWSVILAAYLWYKTRTLPSHEFAEARLIWRNYEADYQNQNGEATCNVW